MNNKIYKKVACMAALAGGLMLTGCTSDFLDTVPTDQVSSATVWTNRSLADRVVNGIYERLTWEYRDNPWWTMWDAYTEIEDQDQNWVGGNAPILMGSSTASSGNYATSWQGFYEGIYRCNDVINNISKVPDMDDKEKGRDIAEAKVMRAWEYYRANCLWQGIPIYTENVETSKANKPRSTADEVWNQVIKDCTEAINEPNFPDKYAANDANYGRVTKGAAYMLRGQAYMWLKKYDLAEADFKKITTLGYKLFNDYGSLFTEANEKNDEYIYQYQYTEDDACGNFFNWTFGNRCSAGSAWDNYIPNPAFVDSYEEANGKKFNMDDYIPGYSSMKPEARRVYFLRDGLTEAEKKTEADKGADMSKYLPNGNEERIKKIYANRDPRMAANFITPYSTYVGGVTGKDITYTMRWPYRGADNAEPYDLRTDVADRFFYLWRKFVYVGTQHTKLQLSPIDIPVMRYSEALLSLAEALTEEGKWQEAIPYVNEVRKRAGVALLNSNEYTQVKDQADMRQRIRDEYGWELAGENTLYFKELRWGTWAKQKFQVANGMTEVWGTKKYTNAYQGEYSNKWPIPQTEIERNSNLKQNEGWY